MKNVGILLIYFEIKSIEYQRVKIKLILTRTSGTANDTL
jgi:hypothetical protein